MVILCEDCGIIVYWDDHMKEPVQGYDDISRPPYITEEGNVLCMLCGQRYEEQMEAEAEDMKFEDYYNHSEKNASEIVEAKQVEEKK